jgi:hypothetical protein
MGTIDWDANDFPPYIVCGALNCSSGNGTGQFTTPFLWMRPGERPQTVAVWITNTCAGQLIVTNLGSAGVAEFVIAPSSTARPVSYVSVAKVNPGEQVAAILSGTLAYEPPEGVEGQPLMKEMAPPNILSRLRSIAPGKVELPLRREAIL